MATKRKREAIEQDEDPSQPPHKKTKLQHKPPTSKCYDPGSIDQQHYKKMFLLIYESGLIIKYNVPLNVIKNLSEFANGEFYECSKCNEQVSFLSKDVNALATQAVHCNHCSTELYWHFCSIHNKYCTSIEKSGTKCETCHCAVCHKCIKECGRCGHDICLYCISAGNKCKICAQFWHSTSTSSQKATILTLL